MEKQYLVKVRKDAITVAQREAIMNYYPLSEVVAKAIAMAKENSPIGIIASGEEHAIKYRFGFIEAQLVDWIFYTCLNKDSMLALVKWLSERSIHNEVLL